MRSLNDLNIPDPAADRSRQLDQRGEGSALRPGDDFVGRVRRVHDKDFAYSRLDSEGKGLGDELKRIGFNGEEPAGAHPVHAFFELHIEQGPILEDEFIDVGVVTHGQGQRWYEIRLTGFGEPRRLDADAA